jgi:hypothetical protein
MTETIHLAHRLHNLVAQHGMVAVLHTLASIMVDRGNVAGGMVSEIAAIEEWLVSQYNLSPRPR